MSRTFGKVEEAAIAYQRGDVAYVHQVPSSTLFFAKRHAAMIQEDVNAIAAPGWKLNSVQSKLGYRVYTFMR